MAKAPKLINSIQARRLAAIENPGRTIHTMGQAPRTTSQLFDRGYLSKSGGKVALTGRVMQHARVAITIEGREALAAYRAKWGSEI